MYMRVNSTMSPSQRTYSAPISTTPNSYRVLKARPDHVEIIVNIVNQAFSHAEYFRKRECLRISQDEVTDIIKNPIDTNQVCSTWYLLEISTRSSPSVRIISVALLSYPKDTGITTASLHMFATLPEHNGKGLGKRLLEDIEQIAFQLGKKHLTLECANVPGLVRYYERLGFQQIATATSTAYDTRYVKPAYGDEVKVVHFSKQLTFNPRLNKSV